MNFNQENSGGVTQPAPLKETPTDIGPTGSSLGNLVALGIDVLQAAQAGAACGQYPTGGAVPIVAPAAPVQPAVGEVQL